MGWVTYNAQGEMKVNTSASFIGASDTPSSYSGQAGRVVYVNAGETAVAFATGLYWDDVNGRLGVHESAPEQSVHVTGDGAVAIVQLDSYGVNTQVVGRTSGGTVAAPTATTSGTLLLGLAGRGYSGGFTTTRGFIGIYAEENYTVANQGAYIRFETTPSGSTSRAERMRLSGSGFLGVNTSSPGRRIHVMDESASTDVVIPVARLESQVTGGAGAAGHGPGIEFYGETTTTENQSMVGIAARWTSATHAARLARVEIRTAYIGTDVLTGVIVAPATASADGNARGAGAVDLQGYRNAVTQVASGVASFVAGYRNTASDDYAVALGESNISSGQAAFAVGGGNTVSGDYSAGMGALATVTHNGAYVWACSVATASWGTNTWTARCHGGAIFYSAAGTATGVQLAAGANAWGTISSRASKDNFAPAEGMLDRLLRLPIYTYNLKSQDPSIRHVGPVVEEFNPLFGFTESEGYINSDDKIGVCMAAIKELGLIVRQLQGETH